MPFAARQAVNVRLSKHRELNYLVANDEASGKPRPVLCFLHGYDEGAPAPIGRALTRHGPLRAGSAGAARDFLIIAPQLPMQGDLWRHYAGAVREIVEAERDRCGADPARACLTGFSFGGNGVFDLALLQPGFWCALWSVDPTRVPARDPGVPVWLSIGAAARWAGRRFVAALGLTQDSASDRVYTDEGCDHVETADRAYRDERVYAWLSSRI